jgi:sugar lactone lactonase YvrE
MSDLSLLLAGLVFPESPRWHTDRLWLADWGANEIVAVDLEGENEVVMQVFSFPFSIDWLPDGRLLVVSAAERCLLHEEQDGSLALYSDLSTLARWPWNEIVVDGRGNTYVNNTGFDFPGGEFAPGMIALVTPDGSAQQVADDVAFPNGMAVTPDNKTLIVAESYGNRLTAFDIAPDGTLSNRRAWADLGDDHPDGICLDDEGAVWYADVGQKHCVRVAEGGEVLQTVDHDRGCFACMLGGPDGRTLFIVANQWEGTTAMTEPRVAGQVLAIQAPAARAGWP